MESALSDEADPLYQPLEGIDAWSLSAVDEGAWEEMVGRLRALREAEPDWHDMVVGRGALLAAAYPYDREVALSLLRGEASLGSLPEPERLRARANYEATCVARDSDISERSIRRIHEVACRHQLTHRVRVDDRVQDHVMAPGDYKHHPNHVLTSTGEWRATAPVALVRAEMAKVVAAGAASVVHPVVQAAFVHHALLHVQPFAAGNGRVARALASGVLLRAAGIPLPAHAESVDQVQHACEDLVDLVHVPPSGAALERWRAESEKARLLRASLVPALASALDRYQRREYRRADLSSATVVPGEPLVLRMPLGDRVVVEILSVDAHPLDGGSLAVHAGEARLSAEAGTPLEAFLERVVAGFALRVAAELEE